MLVNILTCVIGELNTFSYCIPEKVLPLFLSKENQIKEVNNASSNLPFHL